MLRFAFDSVTPPAPQVEPDHTRIVAYLRRGAKCAVEMRSRSDPYRDHFTGRPIPLSPSWRTDGEWVWPAWVTYHLNRYHLALPEEFLRHGRALSWQMPAVTDDRIAAAGRAL